MEEVLLLWTNSIGFFIFWPKNSAQSLPLLMPQKVESTKYYWIYIIEVMNSVKISSVELTLKTVLSEGDSEMIFQFCHLSIEIVANMKEK